MQLLEGLDQALSFVTGLHQGTHLHLTPPSVYLCALRPIPGGPHCHMLVVRPSSHGSAQPARHTQSAPALAACPGPPTPCVFAVTPCHCRRQQRAPAAACVHRSSHHCCLPWSTAAGSGDTAEDPNSPCSLCELPVSLVQGCGP